MLCRSTGSSASSDSLGHLLLSKMLLASTSALLLPLPSFLSWLESKLKCKPIWLHRIGCNAIPLTSFSSVQLLSCVQLVTPWIAAHQAFLSITNSGSLLKLMFIELVRPSNHLILCRPLLLLPSIFPSMRVFSNESVLCIRLPKCWSFSFSISPSNECSGLISFRMD